MSDAGKLTVTLTADQAEFTSGMTKASQTVNKFGDAASNSTTHMEKFNLHMLTSRSNLRLLSEGIGVSVGHLRMISHVIGSGGVAIAGAVGGLYLLKNAYEETTRVIRQGAEDSLKFYENLRNIRDIADETRPDETPRRKLEHAYAEQKKGLTSRMEKLQEPSWTGFLTHIAIGNKYAETVKNQAIDIRTQKSQLQKDYLEDITHYDPKPGELLEKYKKHRGGGGGGHMEAAIGGRAAEAFKASHDPTVEILEKISNGIDRLNNKREGMLG